jgi:hypothetical protein
MGLTAQADNIDAIERYIGEQEPARTAAAVAVRDDFLRFMAGLGDYARNFEQQAYDRVRNFKLDFNRANAVTPAEKAAVEDQAINGLSTEQLEGKPDRRTAEGKYVPPPSGGDQLTKIAIGVGLFLGLVLVLRK